MIKAGIIGSTGYAGGELVRILTGDQMVRFQKLYRSKLCRCIPQSFSNRGCEVYG